MHSALITLDNEVGIVSWGMNKPEPEPEPPALVELVQEVYPEKEIVREIAPPIRAEWGTKTLGFAGKRRTNKTLKNLYAAFDEGVHTNWDVFGHEIEPLPTLDDIERVWA
jgi:hypothetical protein